ncbi:MAG: 2-oxoacid:acceptor oxidoreductase family protein [Lentisphaeria bacterium]|jgi:2-oxoisovalerate ferredoxin oxidoreductase beta subunit
MTVIRTQGLYEEFTRKGGPNLRATHYCAGCGHGILHKLVGEALADFGLQDRAIFISPVGCAVFGYYYMDCGNVQAAHGRAAAVAAAITRTRPEAVAISYQGDGDLASIGLNQTLQAANRGDRMAILFVNNATYGMTGGQLAPTSLVGQKTLTSPDGRDPLTAGWPLHMCELVSQLQAPVYIERVSVADAPRIRQARAAIRKALELQRDGKGFAFVEILSPCPTNMHTDSLACAEFFKTEMEKEFPLGCLRDRTAEAAPHPPAPGRLDATRLFADTETAEAAQPDPSFAERRLKFSGFGGQGILRMGVTVAAAAQQDRRFVSWFPSYGPEQRGGAASCAVVLSGQPVGSPVVDAADVLVAFNQAALERFAPETRPGGVILHDASVTNPPPIPAGVRVATIPAVELADRLGVPQAANTAMLAGLAALDATGLPADRIRQAVLASFAAKPAIQEKNRKVYDETLAWCRQNWPA